MTPSLTDMNTQTKRHPSAPTIALRVVGSAVIAFAMAYRNVAIAGPANKEVVESKPTAPYAAPVSETGDAVARAFADDGDVSNGGVHRQSLVVVVDHLQRVSFDEPVKTVLVGNPAIADVTMISTYEAVVTAKSVGATNLFFLDPEGRAIGDYGVVVREGEERRVVLRRGPGETELYQCAPRCERTLSQLDSSDNYNKLNDIVQRENKMIDKATKAARNASN